MNLNELYKRRAALLPAMHEYLDVCNEIVRLKHAEQGTNTPTERLQAAKRKARTPTRDEHFLKSFAALPKEQQEALLKGVKLNG